MVLGNDTSGHIFDTTFTTNGTLYSAASGVVTSASPGNSGQLWTSNGAGSAPSFQSATAPAVVGFQAYLSGNASNVTGDGTAYTIAFNTTSYNTGSNFNTGTFTYTAPSTGKYLFNGVIYLAYLGGSAAVTTLFLQLVTTATTFQPETNSGFASSAGGTQSFSFSITCQMTSGDTAKLVLTGTGGTKEILVGGTLALTNWEGQYLGT